MSAGRLTSSTAIADCSRLEGKAKKLHILRQTGKAQSNSAALIAISRLQPDLYMPSAITNLTFPSRTTFDLPNSV